MNRILNMEVKKKQKANQGGASYKDKTVRVVWYSHKMQKQKKAFLFNNPFCVFCQKPADIIDHITPHKSNIDLLVDVRNWQPICTHCHNTVKKGIENGILQKQANKMLDPKKRRFLITDWYVRTQKNI